MTPIITKNDVDVELIQSMGTDAIIAHAAWVSTKKSTGSDHRPEDVAPVINFLMANRHGTPFEHVACTIRVHAPIKVWREWHRHRVGWSYNEESGRYKQLDPIFYVPARNRPMIRPEGFRSSKPRFEIATIQEWERIVAQLTMSYQAAYDAYEQLLDRGYDRGLARDVLGVGIYSACYCTANARSIMHFLELRAHNPLAKRISHPLWEIQLAASKLEYIFANLWPVTYHAWCNNGRMAP